MSGKCCQNFQDTFSRQPCGIMLDTLLYYNNPISLQTHRDSAFYNVSRTRRYPEQYVREMLPKFSRYLFETAVWNIYHILLYPASYSRNSVSGYYRRVATVAVYFMFLLWTALFRSPSNRGQCPIGIFFRPPARRHCALYDRTVNT